MPKKIGSAATIVEEIDEVIADHDMYETGEPRPTTVAVAKTKKLIELAEQAGSRLGSPGISVFFGIPAPWLTFRPTKAKLELQVSPVSSAVPGTWPKGSLGSKTDGTSVDSSQTIAFSLLRQSFTEPY